MFRITNFLRQNSTKSLSIKRTFLSQAYYCDQVWQNRLNSPLLQKVNLDLLYFELDQRFNRSKQISAVDVDIYANAMKDDLFVGELLDLVYKLRLSAETGSTLPSTPHAVIRLLLKSNKIDELLRCLDDRLNYGLFLDDHTANILLDSFWKSKNYTAGAFVAGQLMLQEDFSHPLSTAFSILHCYNYLLNPGEWPQAPAPKEPEEEVKVRVRYLRNPYDDQHFDLKDGHKIVGKTLSMAAKGTDPLETSLRLVGLALYGDEKQFQAEFEANKDKVLIKEIVELLPEDNKLGTELKQCQTKSEDVQKVLEDKVKEQVAARSEKDIAEQCKIYENWEKERVEALEAQKRRLDIAHRLAEIEKIQKELKEKEERLWFFENEEKIELQIAEKESQIKPITSKAKKQIEGEEYIPPEVMASHNK